MIKNKKNDDNIENKEQKAEETVKDAASEAKKEKTAKKAPKKAEKQKHDSKELEAAKKENAELNDRYLRLLAEYDNFKKRTVKEKEAIYVDSVGDAVTALLPVIDNFERALNSFKEEDKDTELYKGMQMIYNQTIDIFTKLGVAPIAAEGEQFDPTLHNAVMHIEDETIDDNTVVEEFQKGYKYRDKVIRFSMVKVAN
ncbi:MAG: nucleotide exchange factor GrpE [Clostridia bacterium]|nr:nucleotide exchange factor GrpE [Clostridia bacterium]